MANEMHAPKLNAFLSNKDASDCNNQELKALKPGKSLKRVLLIPSPQRFLYFEVRLKEDQKKSMIYRLGSIMII